ncbi:integrin-like protein [Streptomyces mangrovisoli]|uniref:Integrin-like protein n=2 Tax=Streptomyces mangrovisoli TaxID=1428628 RepID=A0A1J4P5A3_9ACTN|nr:integrin-like protein [Streptomyces mangrovisoli]
MRTYVSAAAVAAAVTAGLSLPASAAAAAPTGGDFNGDGYADLAVGVPDGTVDGKAKAGYVTIVYGGPKGIGAYGSIRVSQATAEVPGSPEAGDRFGASVALLPIGTGGKALLLVGTPGEDITGLGTDVGMVEAVSGTKTGTSSGSVVLDGTTDSAQYGLAVTAADVTGDGNKEIVIGGKDKVVARVAQGEDSMVATVVTAPMGGRAPILATGDFTGDGRADLAVAYRSTTPSTQSHVRIWAWDPAEQAFANTWNTDNTGVSALAAGDFDGDGHDDLALGECREYADENIDDPCGPEALAKGGGIHIHYGAAAGGSFGYRQQTLNQDTAGVAGVAEDADHFGAALAVGDVDHDGRDDLIAGAPGEAIGSRAGAGAATVLYGSAAGLLDAKGTARSAGLQQDTAHVPGVAESGDAFGAALATGDYDHDGRVDLAVGSPGENAGSGGVWFLPRAGAAGSTAFTPAKLHLPSPTSALAFGRYLGGR